MRNRGEIDTKVAELKQQVKNVSAEMNSIKHFDQDHQETLFNLYLSKPSQDWAKQLETTILENRGAAAEETLVCIQELLDTTANQINFAKTLRLERPGLKAAMQATLVDKNKVNSKTIDSEHFKEDYSELLGTLIEAPLSDEHLVREFIAYDTLRQIIEFFAAVPHWKAAYYNPLKMKLEERITGWKTEDLLKQDEVAFSVLQKFLSYIPGDTNNLLGKRSSKLVQNRRGLGKVGIECSTSEWPITEGKGQSKSQLQSTKNQLSGSTLKPVGLEACYPDGSFLTDRTDEDLFRVGSTPVVKESFKGNKLRTSISPLVEDCVDDGHDGFGHGWSGMKTSAGFGSHPQSKMRLNTSSNTCKYFEKDVETPKTIKSGMSSQHLSRSWKDGYPHSDKTAKQKLMMQPTKLELLPERRTLGLDSDRKSNHEGSKISGFARDLGLLLPSEQPVTIQDAVSKQLTNLNYSEVQLKLKSKDSYHDKQKMLQALVLESFDESRQKAKETLYQALRKDFGDAQALFQAKKLESDIFGLYYNDLNVYQSKVAKCAADLQQMFKKELSADHLMSTCIDYDLVAAIQTHVQNIISGGPLQATQSERKHQHQLGYSGKRAPDFHNPPVGLCYQLESPTKSNPAQKTGFGTDAMLVEHQGLTREEVFGNSQKENSCIEVFQDLAKNDEKRSRLHDRRVDNQLNSPQNLQRAENQFSSASGGLQRPSAPHQPNFDMDFDPFAEDDLDLSANSFEFLECIAKIKEAEINLLNQHLSSVMHENELLREALMHVKANKMLLQSIDGEMEVHAGDLEVSANQLPPEESHNSQMASSGHQDAKSSGFRALPRGEP